MKVVERVGEQVNMRKKVKKCGLKFMYSNQNSKSGNNIYDDFEMKVGVLPKAFLGMLYIISKLKKAGIQHFKQYINQS